MPSTPNSRFLIRGFATKRRDGLGLVADTDDLTAVIADATVPEIDLTQSSEMYLWGISTSASQTAKVRFVFYDAASVLIGMSDEYTITTTTITNSAAIGEYVAEMQPISLHGAAKAKIFYSSAIAAGTIDIHVGVRR